MRIGLRRRLGLLQGVSVLLAGWLALSPVLAEAPGPRVVSVGDVHGSLDGLSDILRETSLIDASGDWAGGGAVLVQLGDLTDRGPDIRGVMDLLMKLQEQAEDDGGEVVVLLGNHEQMNLLAIYRDVSPEGFAAFATDESETLRATAWSRWTEWQKRLAALEGEPEPELGEPERAAWSESRPPGFFRYHAALRPDGVYGRWLRSLPVAAIRGSSLLMHAGLSPEHAGWSVEEINRRHHEAFEAFDRIRRLLEEHDLLHPWATFDEVHDTLFALLRTQEDHGVPPEALETAAREFDALQWVARPDSPMWFRGYAAWEADELAPHVEGLLDRFGVERLVAGHSPRRDGSIETRLDGRVFLIDTGMLRSVYDGRPAALEIEDGRVTAVYPGERETLIERSGGPPPRVFRDRDGVPLPFPGQGEILAALAYAPVVDSRPLGVGVTGASRLVLDAGPVEVRAVFHDIDQSRRNVRTADGTRHAYFLDSYRSQIAAYELTRMLGVLRVPPTVERRIGGRTGSVQLWVENAATWDAIEEEGRTPPDSTFHQRQMSEVAVFDNLIRNVDRNPGNLLYDQDWNLWWIDHTRAFTQDRRLLRPEALRRCSRALWEGLLGLDEGEARSRLQPTLSGFQVDALFERRDAIVRILEERIAKVGAERVIFDLGAPPEQAVKVTYDAVEPDPP